MSDDDQHDDRGHRENHDPTGVRKLLCSLPDPGPMPDAVVNRIRTSLAHEAESRSGPQDPGARRRPGAEDAGRDRTGEVVDIAPSQARRRPRHLLGLLGGAAAAAVVATVLLTQAFQDDPQQAGIAGAAYQDPRGGSEAADDEGAGNAGDQSPRSAADDSSETLTVLTTPVLIERPEDFPARVAGWADHPDGNAAGTREPVAADSSTVNEVTARRCLAVLPEGTSDAGNSGWTVGPGILDGANVVVVVRASQPRTAWALDGSCRAASSPLDSTTMQSDDIQADDPVAAVRLGPVPLP